MQVAVLLSNSSGSTTETRAHSPVSSLPSLMVCHRRSYRHRVSLESHNLKSKWAQTCPSSTYRWKSTEATGLTAYACTTWITTTSRIRLGAATSKKRARGVVSMPYLKGRQSSASNATSLMMSTRTLTIYLSSQDPSSDLTRMKSNNISGKCFQDLKIQI